MMGFASKRHTISAVARQFSSEGPVPIMDIYNNIHDPPPSQYKPLNTTYMGIYLGPGAMARFPTKLSQPRNHRRHCRQQQQSYPEASAAENVYPCNVPEFPPPAPVKSMKSWPHTIISDECPINADPMRPIIITGPSGAGKSSLVNALLRRHPHVFSFAVSHTTRNPRPQEVHGKHYYFISKEDMQRNIEHDNMLEHTEFAGNMYGTSVAELEKFKRHEKIGIFDVDLQGVQNIKKNYPELAARFVFICIRNLKLMEERLRERRTETEDMIWQRMGRAELDMEYANLPYSFELILVNDGPTIEDAVNDFEYYFSEEIAYVESKRNAQNS